MPRYYALATPYTVLAGQNVIHVVENTSGDNYDVTIPVGTYWLYGDGTEVGDDLCEVIAAAMTTASFGSGGGYTQTCSYEGLTSPGGPTGAVSFSTTASEVGIVWTAGTTTFPGAVIGWDDTVDSPHAQTITGTLSPTITWTSNQPERIADRGPWQAETSQHLTPEGQSYAFEASDLREFRRLAFELVNDDRTFIDSAPATDPGRAFEALWKNRLRSGQSFRLYRDEGSAGVISTLAPADLIGTFELTEAMLQRFDPRRNVEGLAAYAWELMIRGYIP